MSAATARSGSGVYEAELAREVHELCRRVLGDGEPARAAAAVGLSASPERVSALGRAVRACRERAQSGRAGAAVEGTEERADDGGLAATVIREVRAANLALPERQRAALALRDHLRLSYAQIGLALGLDVAGVAALLSRARLALGAELRGVPVSEAGDSACIARERALRVLARRQDSEALDADDDDWIFRHLGECADCARAHAAMLEASVRYRTWKRGR